MRYWALLIGVMIALGGCSKTSHSIISSGNTRFEACFTPQDNCQQLLVDHINAAQKSIDVQAYSFTSFPIAKALVRAKARGVTVEVVLDQSDFDPSHFSEANYLAEHGIALWNDNTLNIAHNKVMIIDGETVETGSFNYTKAAQYKNAENMLIVTNSDVASVYEANFHTRQKQSVRVTTSAAT